LYALGRHLRGQGLSGIGVFPGAAAAMGGLVNALPRRTRIEIYRWSGWWEAIRRARWNWKSAVLSSAIRGTIFVGANLSAGFGAAARAVFVELMFVATTNGVYGALTQAFSRANPFWAASLTVMVFVPALAHSVEFLFHWMAGTPQLRESIVASISFSELSALFNVFAMRRGVLVVGQTSQSFSNDLRRLPGILLEFIRHGLRPVLGLLRVLTHGLFRSR
ncbi:MAG: hypothetical protein HY047_08910, partial [Acidobacteria bacterium]|nr:hypothetical protein [Acidobacteriota bacterium]